MPKIGIKMPKVGMPKKARAVQRASSHRGVLGALFSSSQARILGLLFGQPERSFTITELIRLTRAGSGAVQREVQKLLRAGLITIVPRGRDKLYQADRRAFLFDELCSIVAKTSGIAAALRQALESATAPISFAVLFGSTAKQQDAATSDIDVLVVSDELTLGDALAMFADAEKRLGRSVSPTVYSSAEFLRSRRENEPFLARVLAGDHVVLMGSEDGVASPR